MLGKHGGGFTFKRGGFSSKLFRLLQHIVSLQFALFEDCIDGIANRIPSIVADVFVVGTKVDAFEIGYFNGENGVAVKVFDLGKLIYHKLSYVLLGYHCWFGYWLSNLQIEYPSPTAAMMIATKSNWPRGFGASLIWRRSVEGQEIS